jgi:hypothetical protein
VRVALLDHEHPSPFVTELASALAAGGDHACVIACRVGAARRSHVAGYTLVEVPRLPEAPLRVRGFERPLTHVPLAAAELLRGSFDVAHAFSPVDAIAARWWRERRGGPVAFTMLDPPTRATLANRRLTLRLVTAALGESDAVLAADPEVAAAMQRWLAVDAEVVPPERHAELYRSLLAGPVRRRRARRRAVPASPSRR